jgi:hypothetical protein
MLGKHRMEALLANLGLPILSYDDSMGYNSGG